STVKAITSPEEGPATLVSVLEDTLPSNDILLQSALDETPMWVENSLNNVWDLIPSLEGMFIEGMSGMTAELVSSIERDSAPILKDFLSQKIDEIQKNIPDIKSPEGKKAFNEAVREFVRVNLQQVIIDARGSFLEAHKSFKKYNLSERELSPKEITEKKVILAFIRLNEDDEYKNQLADAFFKGFEGFYQQFTVE
ncbi:MAG: hypothetical protein HRT88_08095, partial [Lentisphaeraceae bacterium]|nr:hypothetical protein [Lentisphaeraceae bacterium]